MSGSGMPWGLLDPPAVLALPAGASPARAMTGATHRSLRTGALAKEVRACGMPYVWTYGGKIHACAVWREPRALTLP